MLRAKFYTGKYNEILNQQMCIMLENVHRPRKVYWMYFWTLICFLPQVN